MCAYREREFVMSNAEEIKVKCSLCDEMIFYKDSHNPEPLTFEFLRCCTKCNKEKVIPARLESHFQSV